MVETPGKYIGDGKCYSADFFQAGYDLILSELNKQAVARTAAEDQLTEIRAVADDLAQVLSHMVVGWEYDFGIDLAKHPEVIRVMARYRNWKSTRAETTDG